MQALYPDVGDDKSAPALLFGTPVRLTVSKYAYPQVPCVCNGFAEWNLGLCLLFWTAIPKAVTFRSLEIGRHKAENLSRRWELVT